MLSWMSADLREKEKSELKIILEIGSSGIFCSTELSLFLYSSLYCTSLLNTKVIKSKVFRVDPIFCDIFGPAERVRCRYMTGRLIFDICIFKRVLPLLVRISLNLFFLVQ